MWRNVVKPLETADVTDLLISQKFRHPTKRLVVGGVHVGFAGYGDPAFTDLKVAVYSDRGGSPGKLIALSETVYTKAQVQLVEPNFLKFAGFLFAKEIELQANTWYHLVLVPSAYTGVDASFLAWRHDYPDCKNIIVTEDTEAVAAARHPFDFSLYGYSLEASQ